MNTGYPSAHGLYDPAFEHDACGVGFVANIDGHRSHTIIRQGLAAAANLCHRGAVSADGLTADGAGIMTQVPRKLLAIELERGGFQVDEADIAVGMIFFPRVHLPARER